MFVWPCIVTYFFILKPTRCTNFTNFFWHETLHVWDNSAVHHQEFIHCTLSNGVCHTGLYTAFEQDQDGTAVPSWSCSKAVCTVPVWHILLLSVQWITPDDGQRNCPKHVEFHDKKICEISASSWFYYKENSMNMFVCILIAHTWPHTKTWRVGVWYAY
jgi:hypothetical protein